MCGATAVRIVFVGAGLEVFDAGFGAGLDAGFDARDEDDVLFVGIVLFFVVKQ